MQLLALKLRNLIGLRCRRDEGPQLDAGGARSQVMPRPEGLDPLFRGKGAIGFVRALLMPSALSFLGWNEVFKLIFVQISHHRNFSSRCGDLVFV